MDPAPSDRVTTLPRPARSHSPQLTAEGLADLFGIPGPARSAGRGRRADRRRPGPGRRAARRRLGASGRVVRWQAGCAGCSRSLPPPRRRVRRPRGRRRYRDRAGAGGLAGPRRHYRRRRDPARPAHHQRGRGRQPRHDGRRLHPRPGGRPGRRCQPRRRRPVAASLADLCEGHVLEMRDAFDPARTVEAHLASVRGKAAALFECACRFGAHCAGLHAESRTGARPLRRRLRDGLPGARRPPQPDRRRRPARQAHRQRHRQRGVHPPRAGHAARPPADRVEAGRRRCQPIVRPSPSRDANAQHPHNLFTTPSRLWPIIAGMQTTKQPGGRTPAVNAPGVARLKPPDHDGDARRRPPIPNDTPTTHTERGEP